MPSTTVADVLSGLQSEPGRPRLTWYGPQGERIELSGAVLENWVTKTTNLLVEELDAGPGVRVVLDLPPHWRTLVWALAVWRAGACVVPASEAYEQHADDLVVTSSPGSWPRAGAVVAVALPALARRFDGELPPRALDAASSVMTYGDVLGYVPPRESGAPALDGPAGTLTHDALVAWADGASGTPAGSRALLVVPDGGTAVVDTLLRPALDVLRGAGSLVLVSARPDAAAVDHLARTENVTATVARSD